MPLEKRLGLSSILLAGCLASSVIAPEILSTPQATAAGTWPWQYIAYDMLAKIFKGGK